MSGPRETVPVNPEDIATLRARAEALARPLARRTESGESIVVLDSGDFRCAVRVSALAGVAPLGTLVRLPGAPPWLAGLFVVQGRATSVVDLSLALGRSASERTVVALLPRRGGIVGFAATRIDMGYLPAEGARPVPADLDRRLARFTTGLTSDGVCLLDLGLLVEHLEKEPQAQ